MFFLLKDSEITVYCHDCGYSRKLKGFLEDKFPELVEEYNFYGFKTPLKKENIADLKNSVMLYSEFHSKVKEALTVNNMDELKELFAKYPAYHEEFIFQSIDDFLLKDPTAFDQSEKSKIIDQLIQLYNINHGDPYFQDLWTQYKSWSSDDYEIKQKVIATIDTSYTGEFGIREIIDKSMDILEEMDVMKEKHIVQGFLKELINEKGLASYGEKEVRNNLQMGAVDTLLLSEGLRSHRKTYQCSVCGFEFNKTLKDGEPEEEILCKDCNEKMKIVKSVDIIDELSELAEQTASNVEIISTETEEGMQLFRAFGGIAAILRYHV